MATLLEAKSLTKHYVQTIALESVDYPVQKRITGLLGLNGAGKSTLLHMITGKAACSEGAVTVLGQPARDNPALYRNIGVMSEHEAVYDFQTGRDFVEFAAKLHNISPFGETVDRAIGLMGLEDSQHRKLGTSSRGMRQRMRLAAALVHDPQVLVLDEPLNGTAPWQQLDFHDTMASLAEQGRSVLISSHILEKVETLASQILLMVSGKLAAVGDFRAIREKLEEQAYHVLVVTDSARKMAAALAGTDEVDSVSIGQDGEPTVLSQNVTALQTNDSPASPRKQYQTDACGTIGRLIRKYLWLRGRPLDGCHIWAIDTPIDRPLAGYLGSPAGGPARGVGRHRPLRRKSRCLVQRRFHQHPPGRSTGRRNTAHRDYGVGDIVLRKRTGAQIPGLSGTHARVPLADRPAQGVGFVDYLQSATIGQLVSGVVATLFGFDGEVRPAVAVAVSLGASVLAYTAIFTWMRLITARALPIALVYVLLWEGATSTFMSGVDYLSMRGYTLGITSGLDKPSFPALEERVIEFLAAIGGAVVVTVLFLWLGVRRPRRMDVPKDYRKTTDKLSLRPIHQP